MTNVFKTSRVSIRWIKRIIVKTDVNPLRYACEWTKDSIEKYVSILSRT